MVREQSEPRQKWQRFVKAKNPVVFTESEYHNTPIGTMEIVMNFPYQALRDYTRIGYWHDRKGENEIDIIGEDEVDKRLLSIEVKRQAKNIDIPVLRAKTDVYISTVGRYKGYQVSYQGFSIDDM